MPPQSEHGAVLVLGGGVLGLACALELLKNGFHVELWAPARGMAPPGFLWLLPPYRVMPQDVTSMWAVETLAELKDLRKSRPDLIETTRVVSVSRSRMAPHPASVLLSNFVQGEAVLHEAGVKVVLNSEEGYVDGIAFDSFIVDAAAYLKFLRAEVVRLGGVIRSQSVESLLEAKEKAKEAGIDVVVNATGWQAGILAGDAACVSVFGQISLIRCPEVSNTIFDEDTGAYALYRPGAEHLEIGGIAVDGVESRAVRAEHTEWISQNVGRLLPCTRGKPVDDSWAGFRPGRHSGARVEAEGMVVHAYGLGGSGFICSVGVARQVVRECRRECSSDAGQLARL